MPPALPAPKEPETCSSVPPAIRTQQLLVDEAQRLCDEAEPTITEKQADVEKLLWEDAEDKVDRVAVQMACYERDEAKALLEERQSAWAKARSELRAVRAREARDGAGEGGMPVCEGDVADLRAGGVEEEDEIGVGGWGIKERGVGESDEGAVDLEDEADGRDKDEENGDESEYSADGKTGVGRNGPEVVDILDETDGDDSDDEDYLPE